ncbi:glycoside hydrolase family 3 protein [Auriscalpium vulgare]|uniref:Glycoside hydrolase family 3 protein n=1 Tax=Auriscalpium vulgare TaxID=40419 RepID=A0ACB8S2F9_9AGAM|nr:glycoside hydrolase family 3 protein [Auriscalpium vulgare]
MHIAPIPTAPPFLSASVDDLVKQLKTDEKIALLSGPNWWNTAAIERVGIPSVRMSDGPNGVRGSSHFLPTPAQCLPCATLLAATFDEDLVREVGEFLAEETKIKSSVIILAPTCNIQRSPLGGRAFESFSEDPHLSGILAAAYVSGLQSKGVSATIKHFVANDQEHERTAADSVMSDRALREIYLYPFMLAQKIAQPWAYMTSYGRIGGVHVSENPDLLQGILREEWGFDGAIISDWHGTYSTAEALNAGLDLEMPGPPRWRTANLVYHTLSSQKLFPATIDARAANLLAFVQKLARRNPEVVYGDGEERSRDSPELRAFARRLAANGIVLLKNDSVLPLTSGRVRRIAVIGPNARGRVISGGGSAALKPTYVVTPLEGIVNGAPKDVVVNYTVGCYAHKYLPTLENELVTPNGKTGWLCTFYTHDEDGNPDKAIADFVMQDTRIKLNDFLPEGLTETWTIKLTGRLTVQETGPFELGLTVAGRAKLWVDGKMTIDNWTKQTPGDFFYGQGTIEEKAVLNLTAGKSVDVLVEYTNTDPPDGEESKDYSQPALMRGVRLGGAAKIDPKKAIEEAVKLASESDAVVIVGGLTPEWESEGFDRPSLSLPGLQDELISKVSKANMKTVVVLQVGSAVAMPWVRSVAGVVQAWYQGNEVGNAIADVLFGAVNPSGRLPLTFPVRVEDIAAYPNLYSENGQIQYREDLFVGYKHYQARNIHPLFPFGHGLSYTSFELSDLEISEPSTVAGGADLRVTVSVKVTNTGAVRGSEVVQLYVAYPDVGVTTPALQLRGFAKARDLAPQEARQVTITLDRYAVSFWDAPRNTWRVAAGTYGVFVGPSSVDLPLEGKLDVRESFKWTGV